MGLASRALFLHWRTPLPPHAFTLMWLRGFGLVRPIKQRKLTRTDLVSVLNKVNTKEGTSPLLWLQRSCLSAQAPLTLPTNFTMIRTSLNLVKLVRSSDKQCSEWRYPHKLFLLHVNVILAPVRLMPSTQLLSEAQLLIFLLPLTTTQAPFSSHISSKYSALAYGHPCNEKSLNHAQADLEMCKKSNFAAPSVRARTLRRKGWIPRPILLPAQPGKCPAKERLEGRGAGWAYFTSLACRITLLPDTWTEVPLSKAEKALI